MNSRDIDLTVLTTGALPDIHLMTAGVIIMTSATLATEDAADLLNGAIARRLALLRKGKRQSFDELAVRSGVSKGMLVQIEQGRANPSISTLCRLAAGLGVSVAELISADSAASSPARVTAPGEARILWKGPKGGWAGLLVGSDGPDMLELWSWVLEPGERYEARPHSAGTLELLHVKKGSLVLEVEGGSHVIVAGASAFARTDRPHAYACGGRRRVLFSMVVFEPASAHKPSRRPSTTGTT